MQQTRPLAKGAALTVGAMALVTGPLASGTWAADRAPERSSVVTEDDDTNDTQVNNVPDDGDNRHPSGRDRSVEHGGSGNQGAAAHEPDDDGHGPERDHHGLDQPDGPGGVDLVDQDGNNGCGNDDDFEDDNEGLCGRPEERTTAVGAEAEVEVEEDDRVVETSRIEDAGDEADDEEADVLAGGLTRVPLAAAAITTPAALPVTAEVLAAGLTAPAPAPAAEVAAAAATSAPAGELPFTGTDGTATAAAGALAVAGGWLLTRLGRRRTA